MSDRILILGIDTSAEGDLALAELHRDGSLALLGQQSLDPRRQSAELLAKLSLLLESARTGVSLLSAIVVVSGPGSFTGLRIGLSAAKGIAEAASVPVISISSLAVLAGSPAKETVAVLQAGRDEYYVSLAGRETVEGETNLAAVVGERTVVVADSRLKEKFPSTHVVIGERGAFQAIRVALPRVIAEEFDDVSAVDANYVRRPYTEVNAEAKSV